MNLIKCASHSIDLDALPDEPLVLDVGCRGWDFGAAVLEYRPNARIVAMEPDPTIIDEGRRRTMLIREALVGGDRTESNYAGWSTGEGNIICDTPPWYAERTHIVPCVNIVRLMERLGIAYWDVVKLDCEGSEFGILENWPGPIAGQISVEFHDWTGPWEGHVKGDYYARLWAGPLRHYEVVQHELSRQGEGIGHWDTLLRLRK